MQKRASNAGGWWCSCGTRNESWKQAPQIRHRRCIAGVQMAGRRDRQSRIHPSNVFKRRTSLSEDDAYHRSYDPLNCTFGCESYCSRCRQRCRRFRPTKRRRTSEQASTSRNRISKTIPLGLHDMESFHRPREPSRWLPLSSQESWRACISCL